MCGKKQTEAFRPFCSKHCADIDLSRWLGGRYAIPGAPADKPDADSGEGETDGSR
ncbi:MAG TPA: DNA gyrase inhibitor YacG [Methyloceanibacter sp.]|nr:DNA gyrase inhibitor YacG [Methyloceanibacter sp.]